MSEGMDRYFGQVKDAIVYEMDEWEVEEECVHDERMLQTCFDEFMDNVRDFVTGNANGSYTMSRHQAKENLKEVIFDEDLWYSLECNELERTFVECLQRSDFEECDVIIRDCVVSDNWGTFCDMFVERFHVA